MSTMNINRIVTPTEGSYFLFGPRGTGKSTWLRATYPDAHTINLLDERQYHAHLADPGLLANELRPLAPDTLVIVDEVQRLPALLNEVHRHIEERGMRFILCGSSARKLKKAGTNLLAGRAARRLMHPFVPEELQNRFDLAETLQWGCLPVIWNAPDKRDALEAYVQMYLREEIQAEALVRNLAGFARFLPVAALFHGQVINVSGVARDAGVARTTVTGYLDITEDTLLTYRLPAYESRLRVRERKHPKFYWIDPGVVRGIKRQFAPPAQEEQGHLFEGWVAGLLRAYRDYRRLFDDWFYWAPGTGSRVEVDFLLRRGDDWVAIEVKASQTLSDRALRGLRAIAELDRLQRRILIYQGDRRLETADGIEVLPLNEFLDALAFDTLFP
jgi:predicted AAA+ superfamily ATPase